MEENGLRKGPQTLQVGGTAESDRIRRNEAEVTRQYTGEDPRSLGTLGEILKNKMEE